MNQGLRIRDARKAAGLTQTDLARAIGVSPQAIQQLEAGVTKKSRHLFHIALRLGVSLGWLETGVGSVKPSSKVEKQTKRIYNESFHGWNAKLLQVELKFPNDYLLKRLDQLPFERIIPSQHALFRSDEIPVYLCGAPGVGRPEGTETYFDLTDLISADAFCDVIAFDLNLVGGFAQFMFHCFSSQAQVGWLPRPHNLLGVLNSYSAFAIDSFFMQSSPYRWRTLHLNPHKRPYLGDDVFLYHNSGFFLWGKIFSSDDTAVGLRFDGINNVYKDVVVRRSAIQAIHVVVGSEIDGPPDALAQAVTVGLTNTPLEAAHSHSRDPADPTITESDASTTQPS